VSEQNEEVSLMFVLNAEGMEKRKPRWPGLPDGAKFGKYCQKSLFPKKRANFWAIFFNAKNLPFLKYQL